MNAEIKPEHAGFRKCTEELYLFWKEELIATGESGVEGWEDTLVEYCYVDDMFIELDVHLFLSTVVRTFFWVRILLTTMY